MFVTGLLCGQSGTAVEGSWIGTLDFGFQKLRLVLHLASAAGRLTATADSPDQGATGIPVSSVTLADSNLRIEFKQLGATFDGIVAEGEIRGTFEQGGARVPLVLRPMKPGDVVVKRPQIPVKPYPYVSEEVTFDNPRARGVRLSGTLTVPEGKSPFPAVALITGSGPQTRDQEVFGHPVFLVIADGLTRSGIAVLRYDDRGVGKSAGDFSKATTADFASDAEAALEFLRKDKRIRHAGLLGHSEGATAASMVAAGSRVGFLVLLAPPAVPGHEILLEQKTALLKASGMPVPDLAGDRQIYQAILAGSNPAEHIPENVPAAQREFILSPWFRFFITWDPATSLRKVTAPILALYGEKDLQVLPSQNEPAFRAATKANKHVTVEVLPSLNHLFQTARTGLVTEYGTIEETFSPAVIRRIGEWIRGVTGSRPSAGVPANHRDGLHGWHVQPPARRGS